MEKTAVELPIDQIADVCRMYQVHELSVFGSVLTDRFGPASDVDFLVVFEPAPKLAFWRLRRCSANGVRTIQFQLATPTFAGALVENFVGD